MASVVGIAGGAGSGKSTLAQALKSNYSDVVDVVEFDDYALPVEKVPHWSGVPNWEVPEAYDMLRFRRDLEALLQGRSVEVMHLDVNQYLINNLFVRRSLRIEPKSLIIVEGFLFLQDSSIRELLDYAFFLDVSVETRISRRKLPFPSSEYVLQVFVPMNEKYVDSTKQYADRIIFVDDCSRDMVYSNVVQVLKEVKFLP